MFRAKFGVYSGWAQAVSIDVCCSYFIFSFTGIGTFSSRNTLMIAGQEALYSRTYQLIQNTLITAIIFHYDMQYSLKFLSIMWVFHTPRCDCEDLMQIYVFRRFSRKTRENCGAW